MRHDNVASELVHGDRGSSQTPPVSPSEGCNASSAGVPNGGARAIMRDKIVMLETAMKAMTEHQIEIPTFHHFAPGVYMREIHIPKGSTVVGMIHKTEHLNILSKGALRLATEDGVRDVEASMVVISTPGVKRAATALEDSVWITVHPNALNERDVDKLKDSLVTDTYEEFLAFMESKQIEGGNGCPS